MVSVTPYEDWEAHKEKAEEFERMFMLVEDAFPNHKTTFHNHKIEILKGSR